MRRLLCGVLLLSGCFQPDGSSSSDGHSGGASSNVQTTGGGPSTSASGDPSTGGTATGTAATGTTDPTTSGPTTTVTTGPATTTASTTDAACDPACLPCEQCLAGACSPLPPGADCQPDASACQGIVLGEIDGTCYFAHPSAGVCDQGACVPVCDEPGVALVACESAACVKPDHPCKFNADPAAVTLASLCETGGATTPGCTQTCNDATDSIEVRACGEAGACELVNTTPCAPYACDAQTLICKTAPCKSLQDCALGHFCDINMTGECKQL